MGQPEHSSEVEPDAASPGLCRVRAIYRYPLKSAGGQRLSEAEVDSCGIVGDRRFAVEVDGKVARAKDHPQLAGWAARLADGRLALDTGAGFEPADEVLARVLPGARLAPAQAGHRMVAAVHLIGDNAAADPAAPGDCDPDPRANIVLTGLAPGAERQWLGGLLRLGDVVLRVTQLPKHCLGVYADVVDGGALKEGTVVLPESRV